MAKPKPLKKAAKRGKKVPVKKASAKPKKKALKPRAGKSAKKAPVRRKRSRAAGAPARLERSEGNPIIAPRAYPWESKATFNPTAFESGGKVYIIYRAIGDEDTSVLGYAVSSDGEHISERPPYYIYNRLMATNWAAAPVEYVSGGGWSGGSEDPRVTKLGDRIYMLYTAFDGWGSVRIALTSIKLEDFKKKKWKWNKPVLISPPGQIHKNWVIFPEKIRGKFAIMHSVYPKILIEYLDSLDKLDGKKYFIKSDNSRPVDESRNWDSWFRGIGPAPIKTKAGWLVLYHAMDHRNPDRYRMGAMILDYKDPAKILYRSSQPILEPEEVYENDGYKWGVVYSCGAVVLKDELFVYYGGADKVSCVASIPLGELLEDLKKNKVARLRAKKLLSV